MRETRWEREREVKEEGNEVKKIAKEKTTLSVATVCDLITSDSALCHIRTL